MAETTGFDWGKFLETAIPAAATGITGIVGYKGATGAAKTQAQAAKEALEFQKQMFSQQQANLAPYLATGRVSLNALMRGMGLSPFAQGGPGAGSPSGAPYAPNSPFGSPLLGNISAVKPSALKRTGLSAASGAATGASLGSVVPGVGTAIGAGVGGAIGTLSSLVGRGRKEANQLVPLQNATAAEVDRINQAVESARQSGTLTKEQLQEAHDTVKGLQGEFNTEAKKFGRAGPGGIATVAKYWDPLTENWKSQIEGKAGEGQWQLAAGPTAGAAEGGAPGAPETAQGPSFGEFTKPFTTSDFTHDPGYQARLEEGQKQLDRFFASRGLASSGGMAKSSARYGQTFASNEYQNVYNRYQQERQNTFNRLAQMAGIGQQGVQTGAGLASTEAQTGAGLITDIGAAQAGGQIGGANAITGAVAGGANMFNQAMQLRQIQDYLKANRIGTPTPIASPTNTYTGLE